MKKPVKIHVSFPGQVVEVLPQIETLRGHGDLSALVDTSYAAFREVAGEKLATDVMQADNDRLKENTLLGQLRSHYTATVMWTAFLKYTATPADIPPGELIRQGLVKVQISGDSAGFDTAVHAPPPGHIDDQMVRFQQGIRNKIKRAELMLDTPHDYAIGGMAVIGLPGWKVNRVVRSVNDRLGQENLMQAVKDNAPALKVVAGPREGLDMLKAYAQARKLFFIDKVSPYWFHHTVMEFAGKMYGLWLSTPGTFPAPSELFSYASYVTGRETPADKLPYDLANGVWKKVHYYTRKGPSVHGAMHRNGYVNVVLMNKEIRNWLRDSPKVATHMMNDLNGLHSFHSWLKQAVNGEVPLGKQTVQPAPAVVQPAAQPATYLAKS